MVRTRDKKPKGDSAFSTTKKQKVGRKKLAPATATRAEVHARTLRLATSTAMSAAMATTAIAPPRTDDPAGHPASSETTVAGMRKGWAFSERTRPGAIAVQNFSEILSGAGHYKATQRASAFTTLARLLRMQNDSDAVTAAAGGRQSMEGSAFDEYAHFAAREKAAIADAATAGRGSQPRLTGLSSLERLKAFSATLEAITDTDDDVRRAALQALAILVDHTWISPSDGGSLTTAAVATATTPSQGPSWTQSVSDLERCNALLLQDHHHRRRSHDKGSVLTRGSSALPLLSHTSVSRVQTLLHTVHVALTHALKPVRLSGVELLALVLRITPPALVQAAARAVCRHQASYYVSEPSVGSGSGLTIGAAMVGTVTTTAALDAAQVRAVNLEEEEERWMLTLARRVSALVLRTKHMAVLPMLLRVLLDEDVDVAPVGGESVAVVIANAAAAVDEARAPSPVRNRWRSPQLVSAFLDEVAPQWANHWKELMELRLELLRQEEKLAMASALAQSFATVLTFLKREQQQRQQQQQHAQSHVGSTSFQDRGGERDGKAHNFFSRDRVHYIKSLFVDKLPISIRELLLPPHARTSSGGTATTAMSSLSKSMIARLELGQSLVEVCLPLAGTEEGWKLVRDFFAVVFSASPTPSPSQQGGEETTTPPPSLFRFPSMALLEQSVRLYERALRLFPCYATHLSPSASTLLAFDDGAVFKAVAEGGGHQRKRKNHGRPDTTLLQQHGAVVERLLYLFPAVLNTVVRHLVPRAERNGFEDATVAHGSGGGGRQAMKRTSASNTASEDAALVRLLLCLAAVTERLAYLPDELLLPNGVRGGDRRRGGGGGGGSRGHSSPSNPLKRLEEGFGVIPRLLFSLRVQTPARVALEAVKRPRAQDEEKYVMGGGEAGGVVCHGDGLAEPITDTSSSLLVAAPSSATRTGVLLPYDGIVDLIVRQLLRVLWFISSSGHPLLHCAAAVTCGSACASLSTAKAPSPFSIILGKSIHVLFGASGVAGVLQRCLTPTIMLAHSILFYLNAEDKHHSVAAADAHVIATDETSDAMVAAATQWSDILNILEGNGAGEGKEG